MGGRALPEMVDAASPALRAKRIISNARQATLRQLRPA